jgi:Flp pilus assembly protein TadG
MSVPLKKLHRDSIGAGYSVSVILLLPLFAICIAFAIEVILLCNSYQAVTAALQTASHVSRAWIVHRDGIAAHSLTLEDLVHTASARSMAAFATTRVRDGDENDTILQSAIQQSGMEAFASRRYSQKSGVYF